MIFSSLALQKLQLGTLRALRMPGPRSLGSANRNSTRTGHLSGLETRRNYANAEIANSLG